MIDSRSHCPKRPNKAPRASLILHSAYAACLVGATCVHLDLHLHSGVVLGDLATFGYPLYTLFVRPRAGLLLAAAIIVSNVTHNSAAGHSQTRSEAEWLAMPRNNPLRGVEGPR
jgi:hypothetical protein